MPSDRQCITTTTRNPISLKRITNRHPSARNTRIIITNNLLRPRGRYLSIR